jgi:hypothetical protein
MKGIVAGFGKLLISGDREKHVRGLARNLELEEIVVFEDLRMVQGALDHGLGAGLAVALQQVAFERAGIDADPHRAAMVLGRLDHLANALGRTDIAGVYAQASGAALRGLDCALVVEVDVGHDRHLHLRHDLLQGESGIAIGAGYAHDIGAGALERLDLFYGRADVARHGIGHRLHRDRRIASDRDISDMNLAAGAAMDVAIGLIVFSGVVAPL